MTRGGSSRSQRELASLSPAAASLDPRTEMELLDFVFQLSKSVVYHHEDLRKSDWQDFFRWSLPVQLALIARYDSAGAEAIFEKALQHFESGLDKCNLQPLFDELMSLARTVNRWHVTLPAEAALKSEIQSLISEDLRFAFQKLLDLAAEAQRAGLGVSKFQQLQAFTTNSAWQLSPYALFVSLPTSSCGNAGTSTTLRGSEQRRKQTVAERLKELHLLFLDGLKRIAKSAAGHFSARLQAPGDLPPHVGLLLAFLRLYRLAQDDLNLLSERHLYYYFRTVLGLKEKDAVPDMAHLAIELDKNVARHKLPAGFQFQDAKDANKADIFFKLLDEAIFSQAAVENLRTLYRKSRPDADPTLHIWESLHIAPVANTQDSKGEKFEDPAAASWKTLGFFEAKKSGMPHDFARVGFLIASPTLLLDEGHGTVDLTFTFDNLADPGDLAAFGGLFKVEYSGKKGWETVTPTWDASTLVFSFTVPPDKPLTFADPKVLGEDYGTTDPLVKFVLNDLAPNIEGYHKLLEGKAGVTAIKLDVTANKVRKLILQNQEGVLDGNKPFLPFGSVPFVGSAFFVGSEEAFRKKLTGLTLNATWAKLPIVSFAAHYEAYNEPAVQNPYFTFGSRLLSGGIWNPVTPSSTNLFEGAEPNPPLPGKTIVYSAGLPAVAILDEPLTPLTPDTKNGFLELTLDHDFLHSKYPTVLTERALAMNFPVASQGTKDTINAVIQAQSASFTECSNKLGAVKTEIDNQQLTNVCDLTAVETVLDNQVTAGFSECANKLNAVKDFVDDLFEPNLPNEPYTPLISDFFL
ncbi:MAG: hypothetical protein AAB316_09180, partial [Bacteroidota bacterium]